MDDPLHPADEGRLIEIVARKVEEAEKSAESPLERAKRLASSGRSTSGQIDRTLKSAGQGADKMTGGPDKLTAGADNLTGGSGQIDRTLIPDSSLLKKTLPDAPGGAGEGLASPLEEPKEKEQTEPEWRGVRTRGTAKLKAAIVAAQEEVGQYGGNSIHAY